MSTQATSMNSSLILMMLLTAIFHSASARAETTPAKGSIDSRIRVAAYDSAEVYKLRGDRKSVV